jgi:purine-nucleoside phosphorylase
LGQGADDAAVAARWLAARTDLRPTLALVLGSGFQRVAERVEVEVALEMRAVPGFPAPSVGGHAGRVIFGRLGGVPVCVLSGRCHYYEGHELETVTRPIRALAALGVRDVVLTNAAGGIRSGFRPGDLMLLSDHINLMGANPLRGPLRPGRERFVDLSRAYDAGLADAMRRAARASRVRLRTGVYLAVSGPSYETPAEIRAFRVLGADAVGMSTVPEVIVARQEGLAVSGLSCITNLAAGLGNPFLSHADVLAAGESAGDRAATLLEQFARCYAQDHPEAPYRSRPAGPPDGGGAVLKIPGRRRAPDA